MKNWGEIFLSVYKKHVTDIVLLYIIIYIEIIYNYAIIYNFVFPVVLTYQTDDWPIFCLWQKTVNVQKIPVEK